MATQLWTGPAGPLQPGTSVAQTTFTAARGLPVGQAGDSVPMINPSQIQPGSHIQVEAWGVASNTGTPTLILGLYWGGVVSAAVGGVAIAVSTAKTTTTAMSAWEWHLWYTGRIVSCGTTGSIIGSGYWNLPTSLTAWTQIRFPETAPAAVTIDTSIPKSLVVGATWSASSASNSITCHECLVEVHG